MKNIIIMNKGICGNNTRDAIARMKTDVLDNMPSILIIFFAMNDSLYYAKGLVPYSEYEKNMRWIIETAINNGIRNIVLVTPHNIINKYVKERNAGHPDDDLNVRLKKYDMIIRKLACRYGVDIADLRMQVEMNGGVAESEQCTLVRNKFNSGCPDGVHLTPKGYQMMAELIFALLKNKIKSGDKIVCFGDSLTYGQYVKGESSTEGETYPAVLSELLNESTIKP